MSFVITIYNSANKVTIRNLIQSIEKWANSTVCNNYIPCFLIQYKLGQVGLYALCSASCQISAQSRFPLGCVFRKTLSVKVLMISRALLSYDVRGWCRVKTCRIFSQECHFQGAPRVASNLHSCGCVLTPERQVRRVVSSLRLRHRRLSRRRERARRPPLHITDGIVKC